MAPEGAGPGPSGLPWESGREPYPLDRVALIQMNSGPDPEANLADLSHRLRGLKQAHPDLRAVFTPENALVLGRTRDYQSAAEPLGAGPCQEAVAALAREHSLWILLGSLPIRGEDGGLRATSLLYDPGGDLQAHYEKLHLFDVEIPGDRDGKAFRYRESDAFRPGDREVVAESPVGRLGLSICYDLRFPSLFGRLRTLGAEVILVPAAFTEVTGEAHWETLLRARAVETQCFVLAPAQTGTHPDGRTTWGHSMAVDPWGRVLGVSPEGPGELVVSLDLEELRRVRRNMPVEEHRRYRRTLEGGGDHPGSPS